MNTKGKGKNEKDNKKKVDDKNSLIINRIRKLIQYINY
jgi:hypothetical protein